MYLNPFKSKVYKDDLVLIYGIPFMALITSIVGTDYSVNYIFKDFTFLWKVTFSYVEVLCIWFFFRFWLIKIDYYFPLTLKNSKQRLFFQILVMFGGYVLFRSLFIPLNELFFNRPFNWRIHFNSDLPIALTLIVLINLLYYHWGWVQLKQKPKVVTTSSLNDLSAYTKPTYIRVQRGKKTNLIDVTAIAYCYKKDGLTYLKKFDGKLFTITESLKSINGRYELTLFYRVNRQFLVHRAAIQSYQTLSNRQIQLTLHPATTITCEVNKNKAKAFKEWIKK